MSEETSKNLQGSDIVFVSKLISDFNLKRWTLKVSV